MAGAVDPTYPLLPVASLVSATMLLLVLITNLVRQSWNLGVSFLCFWLFFENFTAAIDTIVWSDNDDIKHYIYCDIASHLQIITFAVKPMATLIIIRRLYMIASLQSVSLPARERRRNLCIEWALGLLIPLLVAGPLYYMHQSFRFEVVEGFGCQSATYGSILFYLMIESWGIVPPLLSITVYYPRVVWIFYRQSRELNQFLRSNGSVSRTNFLRILALASIDILLTLPFGIVSTVLGITANIDQGVFVFYPGWTVLHSDWEPFGIAYGELQAFGTSTLASVYFNYWTSPFLAFTVFGLFGLTAEARASYWRVICIVGHRFGWKPTPRARHANSPLNTMDFAAHPHRTISFDAEMSSHPSLLDASLIPFNLNHVASEQGAEVIGESAMRGRQLSAVDELELSPAQVDELRDVTSDGKPSGVQAPEQDTAPISSLTRM